MNANVFAPGCGVSRPAVRLKPLTFLILLSLFSAAVQAEDITEFNTEVLDLNERGDIDLSQFSQAGYVMPEPIPWHLRSITACWQSGKSVFWPWIMTRRAAWPVLRLI